jgi:opacity protein-like surface antigen
VRIKEKESHNMKKKLKTIVSLVVALVALMSCSLVALADDPVLPDYPDTTTVDDENQTVPVYGTVDASIVSAEVTLSSCFHIDPNAAEGERFVSPDMTIENTSTMPIFVDAVSLKATGDAPKVVADDKYSDEEWSKLGIADTAANIALGLTGAPTAGDFFFAAEDEQDAVRLNEKLIQGESDVLGLQAKFGLSWPAARTFKYELVFAIGIVD